MANIKQQKKRIKTDQKRRLKNSCFKSRTKTLIKKFKGFATDENKQQMNLFFDLSISALDKGLSKKIYHKNFVSRHKSNLSKLKNTIK
ncbi:30S ribosomal protein S20 [Candidatus Phytoplasma pini]|uniref:Small ribosomal subunit protein bS20 n=1 Tax=Candidatus Phytoplasma pini TaxID=267362 RepID=A0A559KK25_9MOLU|nr:30S ribosomal protein S20 [Candidatus Phytoplasma pini]TVY12469.1 30S ribosomal protein S20 [Candidatus Phytoplasma pini]